MAVQSTSTRNGSTPAADNGPRQLPEGVTGQLLVGKLRFVAPSKRSDKQLLLDVETVDLDGHVSIVSVQGWMMEAGDGAGFTTLGQLYAGGHLAGLIGRDVVLAISCRAAVTKSGGAALYTSCEGVWPLGGTGEVVSGGSAE